MTQAIVLVGGQGTRLRPLTLRTAKPLLPTAGQPFLLYQLLRLQAAGITHVVLATSYQASTFAQAFGDGSALGLTLRYAVETQPLGTGGAIANAGQMLVKGDAEEPVVILNGDILADVDIAQHVATHTRRGAQVSLHLTQVQDARAFGCVPTDEQGRVQAFVEKSPTPPTNHINAGCYVFARHVIDTIAPDRVVSVERETFPSLVDSGAGVWGYVERSYWLDVGTPAAYVRANADLVQGRALAGLAALTGLSAGQAWLGSDTQVHPSAQVIDGSSVGEACRIDSQAQVQSSVLAAGCVVGAGAFLRDCALGQAVTIGPGCHLEGVVVGDGASLGAEIALPAGVRVWTDAVLPGGSLRLG